MEGEDYCEDEVCETCNNDWCTCDEEMEEPEPMETKMEKK